MLEIQNLRSKNDNEHSRVTKENLSELWQISTGDTVSLKLLAKEVIIVKLF
jgi:hypothetical protein